MTKENEVLKIILLYLMYSDHTQFAVRIPFQPKPLQFTSKSWNRKKNYLGPTCLKLGVIHTWIWQKTNKIAPVENAYTKYMLRSYWMKNIHLRLGRVHWWLVPVNGECNIVETASLIRALCQTVTCWAVHYQISSTLQKTLSLPNPIL